jgi:hypothetical protein
MRKALNMLALAMLLASTPAFSQQSPPEQATSAAHARLVGLPILSSDGEKIGDVIAVEPEGVHILLVGAIDRPLGIGSDEVAVAPGYYIERGDHIELTVSAADVRDAIARAGR